ncbi:MAG: glycosyltransferase [Vampirovibrionales bacterium]
MDTQQFYPSPVSQQEAWHPEWPRPLYLYAGRVSPEKNIGAFLDLPLTGTKVVVGSGPALNDFKTQYPHVQFLGLLSGESLRATYSAASVLVFPSHTDTFGLVMLEALACGTPVVAFNVTGPQDVFSTPNPVARLVNTNSQLAEEAQCLAQQKPSLQGQCLAMAQQYSWQNVANTLLAHWPTIAWP